MQANSADEGIEVQVRAVLEAVDAAAFVHAVDLDTGRTVGWNGDAAVVTASTFKIFVLLEVVLQAAEGRISLTDRVVVPATRRTAGPTGLSKMRDDVELSVRDLAFWMMCVSDNTATDVLQEMVGIDRVNARLRALGLRRSVLVDDCHGLISSVGHDLGQPDPARWAASMTPERLGRLCALDPDTTNRTTPREMCELLGQVWRDEAGPAAACHEVRRIMALQVWPHRLQAGFDNDVMVSGKTGTLLTERSEVGVVEFPDGFRSAVAVYLRTAGWEPRQPRADAAIGHLARVAVDRLRAAG